MCASFVRLRNVLVALPLVILVGWFTGVDPFLLFQSANLTRDFPHRRIWHQPSSGPPAELGTNAPSVYNLGTKGETEISADSRGHEAALQSSLDRHPSLPITSNALVHNVYANLTDSCETAFWAPRSRDCQGPPQLPSSLPPDKVKKHKFRLKEPRVIRLHNQKCAYEQTRSALAAELAIILMPISIVESGPGLQDRTNMLISAYRSHFPHIAIIGSNLNFTLQKDLTIWSCDKSDDTHSFAYICVARFLSWLMKKPAFGDLRGLVFFHTDFWLHPSYLAGMLSQNSEAILSLSMPSSREGWPNFHGFAADYTDHVCCDEKVFWKSRFHKDQKNHGNIRPSGSPEQGYMKDPSNMMWKTFRQIDQELFPTDSAEKGLVCYGWSDMFRLPRSSWESFCKYAMLFAVVSDARDKHHEVVIPTLLHKLAAKSNQKVKMLDCWGGTIAYTFKKTILEVYPCGHRMQLQMASVRFDFVDAVRCG